MRIAAILQKLLWLPRVVPASFAGDVKMNVVYEKEMVS